MNETQTEDTLLRERQVLAKVPVSHSTLWRWCRGDAFPKPTKVNGVTAWKSKDVKRWMEALR